MSGNPYLNSPRWVLAEEITAALRRRWPAEIHAVGAHGSLAHGEDVDGGDIDLVVVTFRSGAGPRPGARRIDGTLVDLGVIGAEEYLEYARTLSTSWLLAADQYLTTKPLYDPEGWYPRLRDTHLAAALIDGLLTRTYFRDSADAVRRTGLGDADLTELGRRLRGQADELAKRGRPVDGSISELLSAS